MNNNFYVDISFPFGLRWAAASCQDTTGLVARHLTFQDMKLLNYIDDFARVAPSKAEAQRHFEELRAELMHLGLTEADHKASPLSQTMVGLGLKFNTLSMMITIPQGKLDEISTPGW